MILTATEIQKILEALKWEPIFRFPDNRHAVMLRRGIGYSDDPAVAGIEGKLSVMLEMAAHIEARGR